MGFYNSLNNKFCNWDNLFQNLRLSSQWSLIINWFFGNIRSFRDLNQDSIRQFY